MTTITAPKSGVDHPWKDDYRPIHIAAVAYMVLIGWFSCLAWIEADEPFRAAMCAGAQVLAVACAILARRAFTADMLISGLVALVFAGGCAFWAGLGVKHAWEVNGNEVNIAMVIFLAALEPGLFLLAEHIEEKRTEQRNAKALADAETKAELDRIRAKADAEQRARDAQDEGKVTDIADHRHGPGRVLEKVVTGAAVIVTGQGAVVPDAVARPGYEEPALRPAATTQDLTLAVVYRFGDAMAARGEIVTYRPLAQSISEATGIEQPKVKAKIERLMAAAGVKLADRYPKPAKPLAA